MIRRIIGIDYGAKRVGIAISDDAQLFAFPKDIYENNDSLIEKIAKFAEEESAEMIVVGESDNPTGGKNTIMRRIAFFAEALHVRTDLPIEKVSEIYTSAEAKRSLETKIKNRKDKNIPVDSAAAALILQTYLDKQKKQLTVKRKHNGKHNIR